MNVLTGTVQQTSTPLPWNAEADSLTSILGTYSLVITIMGPLIDSVALLH